MKPLTLIAFLFAATALGAENGQVMTDNGSGTLSWVWRQPASTTLTNISANWTVDGVGALSSMSVGTVTMSGLTASKVVKTDGSKNLVSATAGTDYSTPATRTSTHSSPSTTTPLSPTWTSELHVVWYGATGTINLPAASGYDGKSIIVYNTGAFTITIDSNGSEVIVRDGTAQTGGVSITLSSGAGNYVALICDGTRWVTLGYKGTLAQGT